MIPKPFADIRPEDIRALIDNQVPESRTLDYKAELVVTSGPDKLEFLKDVSAFANAEGGDIVFGVAEKTDGGGKNTGLPDRVMGLAGYNHDQEVLRLESVLVSGLKPRLVGVRFREVQTTDGPVLVVRVERGFAGPHMVISHDHYRFWGRHSRGKYMLDADELRRLFLRSAEFPERVRRLRAERVDAITRGETPLVLENNPKVVLQVVSLKFFDPGSTIDLEATASDRAKLLPFGRGGDTRYNLDGYLCFSGDAEKGRARAYTQVFRNGALEVVDSTGLRNRGTGEKRLDAEGIAEAVLGSLGGYLSVLEKAGAGPPFVVLHSLLGVKGYFIPDGWGFQDSKVDRESVLLPEVVLAEVPASLADALRPMFDALWQSSGWDKWPGYEQAKQRYG